MQLTRAWLGSGELRVLLGASHPLVISHTAGPISKIQMAFDISVRQVSKKLKNGLEVIGDVAGQVKVKIIIFRGSKFEINSFSFFVPLFGLLRLASKIYVDV